MDSTYFNTMWPTSDQNAAYPMPQPMFPAHLIDYSSSGRVLSEVSGDLEAMFDRSTLPDQTMAPVDSSCYNTNWMPTTSAADAIHPADRDVLREPQPKRRLKHPTSQDWQHLKAEVVRRYVHEGAPTIVKRLRHEGYNVTIKMLRDRLSSWGANTKQKRSSSSSISAFEPSRTMNTSTADIRERHLLREIDRFFDVSYDMNDTVDKADRPPAWLLRTLGQLAYPAVGRDDRGAWRCIYRLADKVARANWSLIQPHWFMSLVDLVLKFAYSKTLSPLTTVVTSLLTRSLSSSHPIALLLHHLISNAKAFVVQLGYALLAMHESKLMLHKDIRGHATKIALARQYCARMFISQGQESHADHVLSRYAVSAGSAEAIDLHQGTLRKIYHMLAQSSIRKYKYEEARRHYNRAARLADGEAVVLTISNTKFLARYYAWSGQFAEAREVLQMLAQSLHNKADDIVSGKKSQSVMIAHSLEKLCDRVAKFDELDETVQQLRSLRLTNLDDGGDDVQTDTTLPGLDIGQITLGLTDDSLGCDRVTGLNLEQYSGYSWPVGDRDYPMLDDLRGRQESV